MLCFPTSVRAGNNAKMHVQKTKVGEGRDRSPLPPREPAPRHFTHGMLPRHPGQEGRHGHMQECRPASSQFSLLRGQRGGCGSVAAERVSDGFAHVPQAQRGALPSDAVARRTTQQHIIADNNA